MHGYYFYQFQAAGLITDRVVSGSYNASNFNISIPVCKTAVKMFFIQSSEVNFIFCFSLNPLEPCPLPQEEQYIVTMMTIATTIPIIHVQILTLVENEQSIFDMMFINHHLLPQSSTILLVQILTLVEKDAKERMLKFQASSPDSYFYVYRCTPHTYHFN